VSGSAIPVGRVEFGPEANRSAAREVLDNLRNSIRVVRVREPIEVRRLTLPPCEECGAYQFHREGCSVTSDTMVPGRPSTGERIRAVRGELPTKVFAVRVGCSVQTLGAWERDVQRPTPKYAGKLSALGVDLDASDVAELGRGKTTPARDKSIRLTVIRRRLRQASSAELHAVEAALKIGGRR
jgi:transcriptional regulator with XRE-family HTH domain